MKDEIKEILDIERYRNKDGYVENISLLPSEIHKLLDYITNLQTIEQQYSAILSENAELENKITNLQEELEEQKRIEQEDFKTIQNLEEENEKLKETIENLTTMTVNGDRTQIKNTAQYKLDIYKSRNEKAIEYTKQFINGKTSNIDEWKNVELVLETIVQLLQGEDKDE